MRVDPTLTRQVVSYQGNKREPGLRWFKFKEGFSSSLVRNVIEATGARSVLDPFSGLGTTALNAGWLGVDGLGIEIMPCAVAGSRAINSASHDIDDAEVAAVSRGLMERLRSASRPAKEYRFPHVRITERAFPAQTETDIAKAREYIGALGDGAIANLLDFACMSVLEEVSYTRKDGQYLRWDWKSGRNLRSHVDLGQPADFRRAIVERLSMIEGDIGAFRAQTKSGRCEFWQGSCLERLAEVEDESIDLVVTSPPYANRYDYTRTYALELAWMGLDEGGFSRLRQQMITATVENKPKVAVLLERASHRSVWSDALEIYGQQEALAETIEALEQRRAELSNPHVIRLLEGYFQEMAYVIGQIARILARGGTIVMVNDNVQYHGEQVPVDHILSDFAESFGLRCESIRVLPRGKGNSSQQMGKFGRTEIRKCVYVWRK